MITALLGDITRLDFEIVALGANENHEPINTISQTIYDNGGEELKNICGNLEKGKLGSAQITDVKNGLYQKVILVVPPVYIDGKHKEAELLKAVYWNSMALAFDYLIKSEKKRVTLAFSSMNVEGKRYPSEEAAQIAVGTIKMMYQRYWESKHVDVVFVCDNPEDYAWIKKEIRRR